MMGTDFLLAGGMGRGKARELNRQYSITLVGEKGLRVKPATRYTTRGSFVSEVCKAEIYMNLITQRVTIINLHSVS